MREPTYLPPPPTWVIHVARLSALTPVPSSLWRLPLMFGISMGMSDAFVDDMMSHPFWMRAVYLVGLGVITDGCAYLTMGLVRPWGEVFPGWLPVVGGRRVSGWFAVALATVGGVGATVVGILLLTDWEQFLAGPAGWDVMMLLCYLPMALWGPTVLVVTADHARRRVAAADHPGPGLTD
ncbi:MAG: hypothetical protein ACRC35_07395 [Angustibacter sp.]